MPFLFLCSTLCPLFATFCHYIFTEQSNSRLSTRKVLPKLQIRGILIDTPLRAEKVKSKKMNNIIQLAKLCPDLNLTVKAGELLEMVEYCVQSTRKSLEQQITDSNTETYPSPEQVSKILGVDKSTLWRWSKLNYLVPISIGGKRRYKMSDVKKLLGERGNNE